MAKNFRPKLIPIIYIVPNAITLASVCVAVSAIRLAFMEKFEWAVIAIIISAILDSLDGRMARLLKSTSKFGAELDSLADFAAFGVTPAIIFYVWGTHELGKIGWAISLLFLSCSALRLARFNVASFEEKPSFASNYFQGVPAPMGALLGLFPLMIEFSSLSDFVFHHWFLGAWEIIISLLMVSTIPTFAFKKNRINANYAIFILVAVVVFLGLLMHYTWDVLIIVGIFYCAMIPYSAYKYHVLEKEYNHDRQIPVS